MTFSEQLRLLPERAHERGPALHGAQVAAGADGKIAEIAGAVVGHRMMLQVAPHAFDRIHLWGIGRQELQSYPTALSFDVFAHKSRAMRHQSVPDDQQLLADRLMQHLEELNDLRSANAAVVEAKVKPPERHARDHRHLLPTEAILQYRCLAFRGPGTYATRSLGQSRFVDEDDHSTLSRRDFFSSGHLLAFQVRIAFSSRSRARPAGRCTLQPRAPNRRHTDGSVNRTVKRCSIRLAIRGKVHSSVANPAASAPAFRYSISDSHCGSESFRGRPNRFGRRSASMPPSWRSFSHCDTDWRDTETRRATSACGVPAASSRAARRRRRSSSFSLCSLSIATSNITTRGIWTASREKSVSYLRKSQ